MSEDAIQAMYEFDLGVLNSERAYITNTMTVSGAADDCAAKETSDFKQYEKAVTVTDTYHETKSRFAWIPKEQIITRRYEREVVERKNHLQTIQVERDKAQKDLISLKAEILACIKGESVFPKETLAEMITAQEEKLRELDALYESSYAETEKTAELMDNVSKLYEELISFSDLYDSASFEAKKMIVNQLIRRVDVYRGYQINISFNFDLTPYIEGE